MRDPFILLQNDHVRKLVQLKRIYLVSQTYRSPFTPPEINEVKTKLLITDYDDKGLAITHYRAVKTDKYAAVLDLQKPKHIEKIVELIKPSSAFLIFWGVVKNKELFEKQINNLYKDTMRKYIEKNTTWRISRDTTLFPKLEIIYGELFINLKYGRERLRVKFNELKAYQKPMY